MKRLLIIPCLLVSGLIYSQALEQMPPNNYTLDQRYYIIKEKSSTFKGYKEIKENVLDGLWKITRDSLHAQRAKIHEAQLKVAQLEAEITNLKEAAKQKEESMAAILYDSEHIKALGINFSKDFFISMVSIIILALLVVFGVLVARLKWVQTTMREKVVLVNERTREFEEYKRQALEKQMKLSRELQNERNKLQEMR